MFDIGIGILVQTYLSTAAVALIVRWLIAIQRWVMTGNKG